MALKNKIARKAVKTTAKHSARGTASKLRREPLRSTILLALGGLAGFALGRLAFGGENGDGPPQPS